MKKQGLNITVDDKHRIIRIYVSGEIDNKRFRDLSEKGIDISTKHGGYHILWDLRDSALKISIGELYFIQEVPTRQQVSARRIKAAGLVSSADREGYKFVENVNLNRGYLRRLFDSETEALEWLSE